jgi:uncharacterized membrane protein YvbJ
MQEKTCPSCGLTVGGGQLACHFCGASLVTRNSRRLVVIALTAMLVMLVVLFAAQWFVLHSSAPAATVDSGARQR